MDIYGVQFSAIGLSFDVQLILTLFWRFLYIDVYACCLGGYHLA